jgi:hypothetical protein
MFDTIVNLNDHKAALASHSTGPNPLNSLTTYSNGEWNIPNKPHLL